MTTSLTILERLASDENHTGFAYNLPADNVQLTVQLIWYKN